MHAPFQEFYLLFRIILLNIIRIKINTESIDVLLNTQLLLCLYGLTHHGRSIGEIVSLEIEIPDEDLRVCCLCLMTA